MSNVTLETIVVRTGDIMASPVDDELVMMDMERGVYFGLDAVGADIWNRLAAPLAVADLCEQLMREYDVDRATCEADVLAVLNEMADNGLLNRV